jgi:hypothetical protein
LGRAFGAACAGRAALAAFAGAAARLAAGLWAGDFFAGAFLACLCADLLKIGASRGM